MHKIIFDCDNTMGVEGKDVDDGLALLFLLGRSDIDILGITTTFGNSTIDIVHKNTKRMLKDLSINSFSIYKGAASTVNRRSEAAEFLASTASKFKGEITLLATGSLTNLLGAYEMDNNFFSNLKHIVLMGGITEPLVINEKILDELNFSCDPEATLKVLSSGAIITVLTGHICLQAFFGKQQFKRLLNNDSHDIYRYISKSALNWYKFIMDEFGINGFYNWDIVAAVYITHPELFDRNLLNVVSNEVDLSKGYLKLSESLNDGYKVNIPTVIKDNDRFNEVIFESWENIRTYSP
jgi:purine nucleosidase